MASHKIYSSCVNYARSYDHLAYFQEHANYPMKNYILNIVVINLPFNFFLHLNIEEECLMQLFCTYTFSLFLRHGWVRGEINDDNQNQYVFLPFFSRNASFIPRQYGQDNLSCVVHPESIL